MWGVCYPVDREFDMSFNELSDGLLNLYDAADNGFYSLQVEGLLVKYLCAQPPMSNFLSLIVDDTGKAAGCLLRSDWSSTFAEHDQWEALRQDLHKTFEDGLYSHDLNFTDLAIDWLKEGKPCEAGACSRLPEANPALVNYKFD